MIIKFIIFNFLSTISSPFIISYFFTNIHLLSMIVIFCRYYTFFYQFYHININSVENFYTKCCADQIVTLFRGEFSKKINKIRWKFVDLLQMSKNCYMVPYLKYQSVMRKIKGRQLPICTNPDMD